MLDRYKLLFITVLVTLSGLSMYAMEQRTLQAPGSHILSLKNLVLMQLAQEDDVDRLKETFQALSIDTAFSLLTTVLAYNFTIGAFAKCELVALYLEREGIPESLKNRLQLLERHLLQGSAHHADFTEAE